MDKIKTIKIKIIRHKRYYAQRTSKSKKQAGDRNNG